MVDNPPRSPDSPGEATTINPSSDGLGKDRRWKDRCKVILILALLLIGFIILILALALRREETSDEYGVVFDAGSSHTGLFVYKWPGNERLKGTAVPVDEVFSGGTEPGISIFADENQNASEAGSSLKDLIKQALNAVPSDLHSSTPVYLGATSGMRSVHEVNSTVAKQIISSVRDTLSKSGFMFADDHAKIISGEDEGAFGWIAVNYLKNVLQTTSKRLPSVGALELGGGSTQISFIPENGEKATENFRLYGRDYPVYTESYPCYGLNEIYRRFLAELAKNNNYKPVVPNPCAHTTVDNMTKDGTYLWDAPCSCQPSRSVNHSFTFYGALDMKECAKQVAQLFTFNNTCPKAQVFSRGNQPSLTGNFEAFSGYYWITTYFKGMSPSVTINEYRMRYEKFCNTTVDKKKAVMKGDTPVCFGGQYLYSILTQGYGFDNQTWKITFTRKVNKKSVGWSLGYMINATNLIPKSEPESSRLRDEIFIPLLVVSVAFIVIGFLLFAAFMHKKRQEKRRLFCLQA